MSNEDAPRAYAFVVRAPNLRLQSFEKGDWVLMGTTDRFDTAMLKFRQLTAFLTGPQDSCVVYSINRDNIGEVRLAGRHNVDGSVPSLSDILRVSQDVIDVFWHKVEKSVGRPGLEVKRTKAPANSGQPIGRATAGWLAAAMAIAVVVPVGLVGFDFFNRVLPRIQSPRVAEAVSHPGGQFTPAISRPLR